MAPFLGDKCGITKSWDNTDPGMNFPLLSYFLCSVTKTKGNRKLHQFGCEESEKKQCLFTIIAIYKNT